MNGKIERKRGGDGMPRYTRRKDRLGDRGKWKVRMEKEEATK
jgi:hypothetical protein